MQNYLIKMHEGGCSAAPPAGDGRLMRVMGKSQISPQHNWHVDVV